MSFSDKLQQKLNIDSSIMNSYDKSKVHVPEIPTLVCNKSGSKIESAYLKFSSIPHYTDEFHDNTDNIIAISTFPPFADTEDSLTFFLDYLVTEIEKRQNPILFFDNLHEGHIIGPVAGIHKILDQIKLMVPLLDNKSVYFFSSSIDASEIYNKFCEKNQITNKINIRVINVWERHVAKGIPQTFFDHDITTKPKEKLFLSFNRISRKHRIALLGLLYEKNLINDSFYSFFPEFYNSDPMTKELKALSSHISYWTYNRIEDQINKHKHEFPLLLNTDSIDENANYVKDTDLQYYQNSYFSVVTETFFFELGKSYNPNTVYDELGVFFSEKIFKPIACKHPFIMLNRPNALMYLRKLGYKTFHPYINEEYDLIENDEDRLLAIVSEISRLCAMTDDEWITWQTNVNPIIEHNFNILTSKAIYDYYFK